MANNSSSRMGLIQYQMRDKRLKMDKNYKSSEHWKPKKERRENYVKK